MWGQLRILCTSVVSSQICSVVNDQWKLHASLQSPKWPFSILFVNTLGLQPTNSRLDIGSSVGSKLRFSTVDGVIQRRTIGQTLGASECDGF